VKKCGAARERGRKTSAQNDASQIIRSIALNPKPRTAGIAMQARPSAPRAGSARAAGLAAAGTRAAPAAPRAALGDRVAPLLRGPADLLLFPGRLALGALLSAPAALERIPADLERLSALAADPRPLDAKQGEVLEEAEARVAAFLEAGLGAENTVIDAVAPLVPDSVRAALPAELADLLLTPRPTSAAGAAAAAAGAARPIATWTITSDDEDDGAAIGAMAAARAAGADTAPVSPAAVAASQAAAELVGVQGAVAAVRTRLVELAANADPARAAMLKLNLSEAASDLEQRLRQRSPGGDGAAAAAALRGQVAVVGRGRLADASAAQVAAPPRTENPAL
jgi:hypothetical protein